MGSSPVGKGNFFLFSFGTAGAAAAVRGMRQNERFPVRRVSELFFCEKEGTF